MDTSKKLTVVTQFISDNGSQNEILKEVRRSDLQNGNVLETVATIQIGKLYNTIENDSCMNGSVEDDTYMHLGGYAAFTKSLRMGAILTMSFWTDGSMRWLDEIDGWPCTSPGGKDAVIAKNKNSFVEFSKIQYVDINTTY
jgi:cellulose 1,4-beta-cellobiosidase